jgi:hypothetical protein
MIFGEQKKAYPVILHSFGDKTLKMLMTDNNICDGTPRGIIADGLGVAAHASWAFDEGAKKVAKSCRILVSFRSDIFRGQRRTIAGQTDDDDDAGRSVMMMSLGEGRGWQCCDHAMRIFSCIL